MENKKSFMFYHNWKGQMDLMTDVELRNFINNLIRYDKGEKIILNTREEKLCWLGIERGLDINKIKYDNICKRNTENGKKGGAPKGNTNAVKENNIPPKKNNPNNPKEHIIIPITIPSEGENNPNIPNQPKQPDNREKIIENRELEIENDSPEPTGEGVIFNIGTENTGPKDKNVDNSIIQTPSSIDYGGLNEWKENIISTREILDDLTEEPRQTTSTEVPKTFVPKDDIPTRGSENTGPDFLTKGIMINGKKYYPLSLGMEGITMSTAQGAEIQKIRNELKRIINKEMTRMGKLYEENKKVIINSSFLSGYRNELSILDNEELLEHLNSIKTLSNQQKNILRTNTKLIRKYLEDIKYFQQAIKDIGWKTIKI